MRVFQIVTVYRGYAPQLKALTRPCPTFEAKLGAFLDDRYGAAHLLRPVLQRDPAAFLTIGNDSGLLRAWAAEQGMKPGLSPEEVILAQIEHHRAEALYNLAPLAFGNAFLRRLPGCVRRTIAWRAAPSSHLDFFDHDLIVSNFAAIRRFYEERGARTAHFWPAHDPELDVQAAKTDRPTDILFAGGYTQHHIKRAALLSQVAALAGPYTVAFHLDTSRLARLAETPLGLAGPLSRVRRPRSIRAVAHPPLFGRALHHALGAAKIVLNGAIDMAGSERGNMRCFEALGAGCLLVSDSGSYPNGFEAGRNFLDYSEPGEAVAVLRRALESWQTSAQLAKAGHAMIVREYSKERQWKAFQDLI